MDKQNLEALDNELSESLEKKYTGINCRRRVAMIILFIIVLSLFAYSLILWFT